MSKDISEVLTKLIKERLGGVESKWSKAKWGDAEVLCAEDKENWYYRHGNAVYAQAKEGDNTPHCYDCSSKIEFIAQNNSIWAEAFSGPVGGGDVKIKHIPYCPSCEKKPEEIGVIME